MISASKEQLQQELEYTLLKSDCHSWWISKMQFEGEDILEERYAIKFCFKVVKNATETYGMFRPAFRPFCMNRASGFECHKRFKEGRESVRNGERRGRSKEVYTTELIGQRIMVQARDYYVEVLREFRERFRRNTPALFKSGQWHFHQDNAPVDNSIPLTDYLIKNWHQDSSSASL